VWDLAKVGKRGAAYTQDLQSHRNALWNSQRNEERTRKSHTVSQLESSCSATSSGMSLASILPTALLLARHPRDTGKPVRTAPKKAIRAGLHRRGHQYQPRRLIVGDKLEDMHAQLEHERDEPTSLGNRANTPTWNESQHTKPAHTSD
jgi:hypothetical protein